ncbi:hypothetical protein ALQ32_00950 [Pseudomonas syringae pv. tagetis]|uniref:Uncharacterized protein n=1 Tax=Pseudomonas syringae pv. tagetis TaxID=129140 RepID=A0A3M3YZL9_9PSED|nr:hypothetical protein [Pseudomonas syringae group genomosp. 7]RMO87105.1 hypothetical protein ALQ32_00950 [Pseudomonas syringae pv. tagetis]
MGWIYLFLTLAAPIAGSVLLVCFFGGGFRELKRERGGLVSLFKLKTKEGLVSQRLLWLVIIAPVLLAISLGMWVWADYVLDLSEEGFKKFGSISLLSFAVMSLALPLAGLVSKFHSTQQTAKQIEVVSFKNNLDAFYSHRKELIAYFAAIDDLLLFDVMKFEYKIHPVVHLRFFDGSPEEGWPTIHEPSFESIRGNILSAGNSMLNMLNFKGSGELALMHYLQACDVIYKLAERLNIVEVFNGLAVSGVLIRTDGFDPVDGYNHWTIGTTGMHALGSLRFSLSFFNSLCDYAGVTRMNIPEHLGDVFDGAAKISSFVLIVGRLHTNEIASLVTSGEATYDVYHPINKKPRL